MNKVKAVALDRLIQSQKNPEILGTVLGLVIQHKKAIVQVRSLVTAAKVKVRVQVFFDVVIRFVPSV